MDQSPKNKLVIQFAAIASEAGSSIMSAYAAGVAVSAKADGSPVSDADREAERIITRRLAALLPGVPLLAEESFDPAHLPQLPDRFLLVDPLDGTREFLSRNGEFTVNIALVEAGRPTIGCVYAPAFSEVYLAGDGAFHGALKPGEALAALAQMRPLKTSSYPAAGLRAVISRSHLDSATEAFLARLNVGSRRPVGSSLKFCLIARGEADVYPRLAPTMEWDTAAGDAVLTAAGGCVTDTGGQPLRYGKADRHFRHDGFVAWGGAPR